MEDAVKYTVQICSTCYLLFLLNTEENTIYSIFQQCVIIIHPSSITHVSNHYPAINRSSIDCHPSIHPSLDAYNNKHTGLLATCTLYLYCLSSLIGCLFSESLCSVTLVPLIHILDAEHRSLKTKRRTKVIHLCPHQPSPSSGVLKPNSPMTTTGTTPHK